MSLREAATIWMSSMAMKKPTHMMAKANVFLPGESSAGAAALPGPLAPVADAVAESAPPVAGGGAGVVAPAGPDTRVSVAMAD
jgi:hypothetical protein